MSTRTANDMYVIADTLTDDELTGAPVCQREHRMTCSQEVTTLLTLDELIKTMKNVFAISDTQTLGELALFQRLAELTQARAKLEMLAEQSTVTSRL